RDVVDRARPPVGAPALEHAARAAGEHPVAVGAIGGVAAGVEARRRRLGGEHRDVVAQQPVDAQRVDGLVGVARHLPQACTPASVRPATASLSSGPLWAWSPRIVRSAPSISSWTVRLPGWRAQPANPPPSYSIVSLVTTAPRVRCER